MQSQLCPIYGSFYLGSCIYSCSVLSTSDSFFFKPTVLDENVCIFRFSLFVLTRPRELWLKTLADLDSQCVTIGVIMVQPRPGLFLGFRPGLPVVAA